MHRKLAARLGQKLRHFTTAESGAITVDWVVLTAGMVSLGLAASFAISSGTQSKTEAISQTLADRPVTASF